MCKVIHSLDGDNRETNETPKLREDEYFFYKNKPTDKVYWVDYIDTIGSLDISFDKKKILSLWRDYPHNFTPEQKELFDSENPYWRDFFRGRTENEE